MAREQRKLAAIVAADVVGYSRLMGRDESGTLARLRKSRSEHLDPVLAKYGGRLVKLTGDGALVEFASAVDALTAAIEFQQAVAEANGDRPADDALVFCMGVHLGDLIVDGADLYGDSVNVAARLEGEAPAGGILISRNVRDAVAGRVKATFEDLGGLSLKNIERPVRAFRVQWEPSDWQALTIQELMDALATSPQVPLALPDKPSIAVLPFQNMSGDPEQEYFTDGVTEDIITELSRFHSLFVIARNSSFSYRGKSPDIRQVGRELGVRYVLEGSIRKSSNRVRVTAQLIDALTGNHIWAERYDRMLADIFELQGELTQSIVGAIAPQVESTEESRAARRHPSNLTAYEIALRSRAHAQEAYDKADRTLIDQAIEEAKEALAIDPSCVPALLALALSHASALYMQIAADRAHALQEATRAVAGAIELDGTDALGYALRGRIALLSGQHERYPGALDDARRAYELNPNDPFVLRIFANLEAATGEGDRAIDHLHQALRLSPLQSRRHHLYLLLAFASFISRRYSEGVDWASRALNDMPTFPPAHVALVNCLVGTGEIHKAKAAFVAGQKLSPAYFRSRLNGETIAARPEHRRRHLIFMRIAAGLEDPSAAEALR